MPGPVPSREAADLLAKLVAIDLVNPDLVPGGAGEGEIARFVAGWLERAGLDVSVEEAAPDRPNVIGVARGTGGGRSLLLCAHTDTVGVAGMGRPFEPRVENGRLYGRGAFEVDLDEPIVQALRATASRASGREPAVVGHTAWMDSAVLSAAGIPTVIFGPGGEGAHAVVEWVDLADLDRCVGVLLSTAEAFCMAAD